MPSGEGLSKVLLAERDRRRQKPRDFVKSITAGARGIKLESPEVIDGALSLGEPAAAADTDGSGADQAGNPGTLIHEVEAGETLTSLAVRYDMTVHAIRQMNKLIGGIVFPGQKLVMRDPAAHEAYLKAESEAKAVELVGTAAGVAGDGPLASPFLIVSDDPQAPPLFDVASSAAEFVNKSMFRVKVLLLASKQSPISGILEGTDDYLRYTPDEMTMGNESSNPSSVSLYFEHQDLLPPCTQRNKPSLRTEPSVGPGVALHRTESISAVADGQPMPVFLQVRLRLVFGMAPTCKTVKQYWFAVMPQWIDAVYDFLRKKANLHGVESFEPVQASEAVEHAVTNLPASFDPEVSLLSKSELLSPALASLISKQLPLRLQYSDWICGYSTYEDGMSLQTMYRKLSTDVHLPCLMIIRDSAKHVFGVYTTESWRPENRTYGGGESFVFKVSPHVSFYKWTHRNKIFMTATEEYIAVGGGHTVLMEDGGSTGASALWLDGDLLNGSSNSSETFGNNCLASANDFKINGLEVWQFISQE